MNLLVDTNVLSEARHPSGRPEVKRYLAAADEDSLYLSVITLGEIARGIARLDAGPRQIELEAWLAETEQRFAARILPIDRDTALRWGRITAHCARQGHALGQADGLIAATALQHGMAVVTRNVRDFEPVGVATINPCDTAGSC